MPYKPSHKCSYLTLAQPPVLQQMGQPPVPDESAPVRCCYRYLSNRIPHLDYAYAIEKALPIGSGEIESAHRYVVQQRLKRAGSWWRLGRQQLDFDQPRISKAVSVFSPSVSAI